MSRCIVCGRGLKTGRKYCYQHRSLSLERYTERLNNEKREIRKRENDLLFILFLKGILVLLFSILIIVPTSLAYHYSPILGWIVLIVLTTGVIKIFWKKKKLQQKTEDHRIVSEKERPKATLTSALGNLLTDVAKNTHKIRRENHRFKDSRFP